MKRFAIILSVCALLSVACNKYNVPARNDITVKSDYQISFIDAPVTKAYSENTVDDLKAYGFAVACVSESGEKIFIEQTSWDDSKACYLPAGGPWYYPAEEKVNFYAVYPQEYALSFSEKGVSLAYEQNPDEDLLAVRKEDVSGSYRPVTLSFGHILSLIHFKAVREPSEAIYKINSVSVDVPVSGRFSYGEFEWACSDETKNESCYSGELAVGEDTVVPCSVTFIPCNPEIHVAWDVYSPDGEILIASHDETRHLDGALGMGEECTVTIRFTGSDPKDVTFAVEVNPWISTEKELEFS